MSKSLFYQSGGQPGNSEAWEDEKINLETNDFLKQLVKLLIAWVRPRHNGYMEFQDKSGDLLMNIYKQKFQLKVFVKNYLICTIEFQRINYCMTKPLEGLTVLEFSSFYLAICRLKTC